jgi:hypothetical protein
MTLLKAVAIPFKTQSQNKFQHTGITRYSRKKRRNIVINEAYMKYRDVIYDLLALYLGNPKVRSEKTDLRIVDIISARARMLDDGNMTGGSKPWLDGLVRLGWLYDDGWKYCRCRDDQIQMPKVYRCTVIRIWAVDDFPPGIITSEEVEALVRIDPQRR